MNSVSFLKRKDRVKYWVLLLVNAPYSVETCKAIFSTASRLKVAGTTTIFDHDEGQTAHKNVW